MTYSDVYSYQSSLLEKITLNSNFQFNQGVVNDFRHQLGALLDNLSSVYHFGVVPTGKKAYTKKRSHSVPKKEKKKCSGTKSSKRNSTKTMTPPAKIHRKLDLDSDDNSVKDLLALDPFLPFPVQVLSTKAEAPNDEIKRTHEAVHQPMKPEEEHTTVEMSEAPNDTFILAHEPVVKNEAPLEKINAPNEEEHTTVEMNEAPNDASILVHEPVVKNEAPLEKIDAPNDECILPHEPVVKNKAPLEKDEAPNDASILAEMNQFISTCNLWRTQ